jgi:hypothetical protein
MLALAFFQIRHQTWLAIVAAVILPPLLGEKTEVQGKSLPILAAAVPLLIARALIPLNLPESVSHPTILLAHIPPELRSQPVFNEYGFGGPLILAGIRPYIDGRSELYGDEFMTDYSKIADGDHGRLERAVKRYGIRWAILPVDFKLRPLLDRSPQWRRIYADKVGVIYVRTGSTINERSTP